jgi:hypothetical protein
MKTLSLGMLLVCLISAAAHAYDRTLITGQTEVGGYAAPVTRFIEVKEEFGVLAGGRVGMVVNHVFGFGLAGYGTVHEPAPDELAGLEGMELAYGGLVLEYVFKPHAVVHICLPCLVGGGQVQFTGDYLDPETGEDSDAFFVLEPELALEFNIARNWRLGFGVGYRHVSGTDLTDLTDEDLSGVNGAVTVKIGAF